LLLHRLLEMEAEQTSAVKAEEYTQAELLASNMAQATAVSAHPVPVGVGCNS
jgi:hypothetical protein